MNKSRAWAKIELQRRVLGSAKTMRASMSKRSRTSVKRVRYSALAALWLVPFMLVAAAVADSGRFVPPGTAQGWFWKDRPPSTSVTIVEGTTPPTPDVYTHPLPQQAGTLASNQYPGDHLYVSWGASAGGQPETKMFAGIAFDLSGIPSGSRITRFQVTVIEHPNGGHNSATAGVNGSAIRNAMLAQGIMACPWHDFYGGTTAASFPATNDRKCSSAKAVGVPTPVAANATFTTATVVPWQFDLSSMAANWAEDNPAFSLEPDTTRPSTTGWTTSFHASSLDDPPGTGPGVTAQIEWSPPSEESFTDDFSQESFSDFGDSGSFSPSFQSDGLVGDLAPASDGPPPTTRRVLSSGPFEGKPAGFWDIAPVVWLAAVLGLLGLAAAGRALVLDPAANRPPGAVGALMRGIEGSASSKQSTKSRPRLSI